MMEITDKKQIQELYQNFSVKFSNRLTTQLVANATDDGNIAISPSRLQTVMVLLANWASPKIRKHILDIVGSDVMAIKEANILCNKENMIIVPWSESDIDYCPTIEVCTLFWLMKDLSANKLALEEAQKDFDVKLKDIDFSQPEAKSIIDKEIEQATHGLILDSGFEPQPLTQALITDILYFKAKWEQTFYEEDTKEQLFYGTRGKKKVSMMKMWNDISYQETEKCQIAELPYISACENNLSFAMRIFLPKKGYTTIDVLSERRYNEFTLGLEIEDIKLSLPKFTVDSNIDLKAAMRQLGLEYIFESADIIPGFVKNLQITDITQKVKVKVDEHGTEAAALTTLAMAMGLPPEEKPEPIVMTVNRPFIFEIAETSSNTILFTGVVNNIEE